MVQSHLKNLRENNSQIPQFIELEKLTVGSQVGLSVNRPIDRPTVRILTVEPAIDRPVDRGTGTESRALCRSTGPVDRGFLESFCSLAVDRVGRPALQPNWRARSVHVGRPTPGSVDRSGRPAEASESAPRGGVNRCTTNLVN